MTAPTDALRWYAEQVAGCRKLGSAGDTYRNALDSDGGKRAREALATPAGSASGEAAAACWQAMGDENYLFGGGPFEDAHPDDQDAARRIAGAVLAAANVGRLRDALRCALDIGERRLLLPSEVLHWQALLAEPIDAAIQGSANGQG